MDAPSSAKYHHLEVPPDLWATPVENDTYDKYVPGPLHIEPDKSLCKPCINFCSNALSDYLWSYDSRSGHRHSPDSATVSWRTHHGGEHNRLVLSASNGCELCVLFLKLIRTPTAGGADETRRNITGYSLGPGTDTGLGRKEFYIQVSSQRNDGSSSELESVEYHYFNFTRIPGTDSNPRDMICQGLFCEDGSSMLTATASRNRGSEESLLRARKWLWECLTKHTGCRRGPSPLPKRVIDIGTPTNPSIHLHIPEVQNEFAPYAALSYSWGDCLALKTTTENLRQHCVDIPFEKIPRTLREAIFIARGLGLRYIWIDALCIIQDSEKDWRAQAPLMGQIYQGSAINISASSARNLDAGFLLSSQAELSGSAKIGSYFHKTSNGQGGIFVSQSNLSGGGPISWAIEKSYLGTRGWVFQEHMMSPATLHFADRGMVWECVSKITSEMYADGNEADGNSRSWDGSRWMRLKPAWISSQMESSSDQTRRAALDLWKSWVMCYSDRLLTRTSDRLPAIGAVARELSLKHRLRYVSGIFEEDLPYALFWKRKVPLDRYPAHLTDAGNYWPSWSWACCPGPVDYGTMDTIHSRYHGHAPNARDLQILGVIADQDTPPDVLGTSQFVCLKCEGLLQEIQLQPEEDRVWAGECFPLHDSHNVKIISGIALPTRRNFLARLDVPMDQVSPPSGRPARGYSCFCLRVLTYMSSRQTHRTECLLLKEERKLADDVRVFRRIGFTHFSETYDPIPQETRDQQRGMANRSWCGTKQPDMWYNSVVLTSQPTDLLHLGEWTKFKLA